MSNLLFSNNAQTTLASGLTNVALSMNLAPGSGVLFPAPTGTQYFLMTLVDAATELINEIVKCTNITGDVATIVRAQEGTTAKAWLAGDIVVNLWTAGSAQAMAQNTDLQNNLYSYSLDTGAANAYIGAYTPAITTLVDGMVLRIKAAHLNTTTSTFTPNSGTITAYPIVSGALAALVGGEIPVNGEIWLQWNTSVGSPGSWVFINQSGISQTTGDARYGNGFYPFTAAQASNILTGTLAACPTTYRNATLTTGTPVTFTTTGNLTLAIPATSNLGMVVNGSSNRLVWLEAYNGGSPVLCVANQAGGLNFDETTLISPTTIGASSNSGNVIYSASAVSANSPYRVVGFTDVVFTTGTGWSSPTTVQPIGGMAANGLVGYGIGQSWGSYIGSRTSGVTYYNTTPKTIYVAISPAVSASANSLVVSGVTVSTTSANNAEMSAPVPPGASYVGTVAGTINAWAEMR